MVITSGNDDDDVTLRYWSTYASPHNVNQESPSYTLVVFWRSVSFSVMSLLQIMQA